MNIQNITVAVYGARILIDGVEIGGFDKLGRISGDMLLHLTLNADDAGQKALAAASVSDQPHPFRMVFRDGASRTFIATMRSCEMDGDSLVAVLAVDSTNITKE